MAIKIILPEEQRVMVRFADMKRGDTYIDDCDNLCIKTDNHRENCTVIDNGISVPEDDDDEYALVDIEVHVKYRKP